MGLFKKLADFFTVPSPSRESALYPVVVQCHRCGEVIHTTINLSNDLSEDYDEGDNATRYHVRKVLMGSRRKLRLRWRTAKRFSLAALRRGRCFQQIEVTLTFDTGRKLIEQEITGGKFVSA